MERPGRPLERAGIRLDAHLHTVTSSAAFASIRDTGLARAPAAAGERVVDLSAGTSFLTLLLAATVGQMLAVDIARAMLERLFVEAHRLGLSNVELMCANLTEVDLPDGSVDLVVSSYALHHLSDEHKRALVRRSRRRLQPGGRLVIADMMLGRGTSKRDREIVRRTTRRMVRKARGGLWRIAKNSARFTLRRGGERPARTRFWVAALQEAGPRGPLRPDRRGGRAGRRPRPGRSGLARRKHHDRQRGLQARPPADHRR